MSSRLSRYRIDAERQPRRNRRLQSSEVESEPPPHSMRAGLGQRPAEALNTAEVHEA